MSISSQYPVFPNAPINEAIFDIQVKVPEGTSLEKLESIHGMVADRFPEKTKRVSFQASFQVPPNQETQDTSPASFTSGGPDGFLFRSSQNAKVFQARLDGFTFNKLRPYECWEKFFTEAKELWDIYVSVIDPIIINRIGLRYINKIILPNEDIKLEEYILTRPEISTNIDRFVTQFFLQLTIPFPEVGANAIINQTIENEQDAGIPYIFDIDIYSEIKFDTHGKQVWQQFERLREVKNYIFFNSITDKTKELFK